MMQKVQVNFEPQLEQSTFAFHRSIKFASPSEAVVGMLLEKFLGVELIEGVTYQKPLDLKHKADFYIPEKKIVLEWHPIVLKWGLKKENYIRVQQINTRLDDATKQELDLILKSEMLDAYTRRRRLFMDNSPDAEIKLSRLIVVDDFEGLYRDFIREQSREQVKYDEFREWANKFFKIVKK